MKVLLVVIDGAAPRVFCPAVQTGRLTHLQRLANAGEMHQASVTIFPSITPAASASLVTGVYPATHGIAGAAWYDTSQDRIAYYGDDVWVIAKEGFRTFLRDFLVHLNGHRLKAPTLFEIVEGRGGHAACLNFLVYRGLVRHKVKVPWLLTLLPGVAVTENVSGPTTLFLGDFVASGRAARHKHHHAEGVLHRFGMDDAATTDLLCSLVANGALPDLTVAYFADNDFRSHKVGPHGALSVLDGVDAALGSVFDAAGGFDRFMRDTCVIVTSDHGHCELLADAASAAIHLDLLLADFRQASLGRPWGENDEIMICPNLRAAQIYVQRPHRSTVERIARLALKDDRVDLVMWRDSSVASDACYVVRSQRGSLTFSRCEADTAAHDDHHNSWRWQGDLTTLGLEHTDGHVGSTEYPNAFERIAGVLDAEQSGDVWLTARPGTEFQVPGGEPNVGGASHGSLDALDSLSPVIVAGGPFQLPRAMRSIDVAGLCLGAVLGETTG